MTDAAPVLNQLNIVAEDFDATIAFYRRLGIDVPEPVSHGGIQHAEVAMPNGLTLEFDNRTLAETYHAGWRQGRGGSSAVIGFRLPSREAVDALYRDLTAAGHTGRQAPYDTFWGSRYAVVADPSGNDVGLMSEPEEGRKSWPPTQSPTS